MKGWHRHFCLCIPMQIDGRQELPVAALRLIRSAGSELIRIRVSSASAADFPDA